MRRPDLGTGVKRRKSSTLHYETLPVKPPTGRGRPPSSSPPSSPNDEEGMLPHLPDDGPSGAHHESPLPVRQLIVLAILSLAEQTALNSISPYLPEMTASFPGMDPSRVGLDVGIIASCFALAQFTTGFLWGWLSDRIGRKPVILTGTLFTALGFVAFGFCQTFWQAALVQAAIGLVNGNQGVVSTCLGDITDKSNQSKAFTYLPVLYGVGAITGPILGGLLVARHPRHGDTMAAHPYLWPNLFSAAILLMAVVVVAIFLEESLEEAQHLPPLGKRIKSLFVWLWKTASSARPSYLRLNAGQHAKHGHHHSQNHPELLEDEVHDPDLEPGLGEMSDQASLLSMPTLLPHHASELATKEVLTRDTILLLVTYLIFQLCNVSFNSLYPIFASSPPPTGRDLSPRFIGFSLAFAGVVTILFQIGVYSRFRDGLGNRATYRVAFAGFTLAFLMMPFVGYKHSVSAGSLPSHWQGRIWLWVELALILLVKTISSVGGLTSALLLITNSAPDHSVLGTLNGLAQTLSAAGRAVGPFLSGGLFSLATTVQPKGELLAWGVFGAVAFIGMGISFGIRNPALEADVEEEDLGGDDGDHQDHALDDSHTTEPPHETTALLSVENEQSK
ncbi:MAG: hypothetical protein M1823_000277 [Watsoniomyces obsoletus]|nr:MAG: hypothetical protein M1823_000277 [Watsoniomyces obsoletus]